MGLVKLGPLSVISNSLIKGTRSVYGRLKSIKKQLKEDPLKRDYAKLLKTYRDELYSLETSGEEIRNIELKMLGSMKTVMRELESTIERLKKHKGTEEARRHIEKIINEFKRLIDKTKDIARKGVDQEGIVYQFAR